jgi:hypothetical protein
LVVIFREELNNIHLKFSGGIDGFVVTASDTHMSAEFDHDRKSILVG